MLSAVVTGARRRRWRPARSPRKKRHACPSFFASICSFFLFRFSNFAGSCSSSWFIAPCFFGVSVFLSCEYPSPTTQGHRDKIGEDTLPSRDRVRTRKSSQSCCTQNPPTDGSPAQHAPDQDNTAPEFRKAWSHPTQSPGLGLPLPHKPVYTTGSWRCLMKGCCKNETPSTVRSSDASSHPT